MKSTLNFINYQEKEEYFIIARHYTTDIILQFVPDQTNARKYYLSKSFDAFNEF